MKLMFQHSFVGMENANIICFSSSSGDDTPCRSYLYADDLVRWLFMAMFEGMPGRVYNIGSDRALSILELAQTVRNVLHSQNEIEVCQKPVSGLQPPRYVPDISRIQSELQVKIETGLEDAILKSAG